MTWGQKLLQLQILWVQDAEERADLVRRGLGSTFWPPSATETNAVQRIAVEETEHGIPLLIALDVVHGQFTILPTPLAQAASFDPEVAATDARVSADEARRSGVTWTYSPMVDVTRDPRWGRVVEGFGEDVFLASRFTAAKVAGYQGAELSAPDAVAACLKHFVAYGAAEAGRDYNTTDMSGRRLRETYLETFRVGVAAGAASVMASFNALNGHPMHANRALLTGVLKDEWGFDGVVVGDADGVAQLVDHGVAADERQAVAMALNAGIDIVMGGTPLVDAAGVALVTPEDVSPARVDDAVRRVLGLKRRLGLFDRPYVVEPPAIDLAAHRRLARAAAERCTVLLTNDGVAPAAGRADGCCSRARTRAVSITSAHGCSTSPRRRPRPSPTPSRPSCRTSSGMSPTARASSRRRRRRSPMRSARAREADVVVLAVGEPSRISGEASSRADITLPEAQRRLIHAVADTGARIVVVLATGRPLVVEDWIDRVAAVLCVWHLGTEAPAAIAAILSGRVSPGGRLPMTFPRAVGQIPIHHDHESTGRPPRARRRPAARDRGAVPGAEQHRRLLHVQVPRPAARPALRLRPRAELHDVRAERPRRPPSAADDAGDARIEVAVTVTNTGDRDGDDVVMLFVTDVVAS